MNDTDNKRERERELGDRCAWTLGAGAWCMVVVGGGGVQIVGALLSLLCNAFIFYLF